MSSDSRDSQGHEAPARDLPGRDAQQREVAVGAAAVAARLAFRPFRLLARTPVVGDRLAEAGRVAEADVTREVDRALVGPVPDVVTRALASGELDARMVDAVRLVLHSDEFRTMLREETLSAGDETTRALRGAAAEFDDRVELRSGGGREAYGGAVTRGIAFVADVVLTAVALAATGAVLALVNSLVTIRPAWLVSAIVSSAWTILSTAYFVFFWSHGGQTLGMRLLGVRVARTDGRPVGVVRALVRFVALLVTIVPFFVGILPVLFDRRRRALPDYVAGTVVVRSAASAGAPGGFVGIRRAATSPTSAITASTKSDERSPSSRASS